MRIYLFRKFLFFPKPGTSIIALLFLLLISSVIDAQQHNNVETEMSEINLITLNATLKEVTANKQFLSRKQAGVQLNEAINRQTTIKWVSPAEQVLTGPEIYSHLKPSTLVVVSSTNRATGYALDEDGICVTNYHVLDFFADTSRKESPLFVMTADDKCYAVTRILSSSKVNDIAIIKVDTKGEKLKPVAFGADAQVGSVAFTLGHPAHILYFFSTGIVAKNFIRNVKPYLDEDFRMAITTDFSLGESGAPVVDNKGNLVGMVTSANALYGNPDSKTNPQMVLRIAIPLIALKQLIKYR